VDFDGGFGYGGGVPVESHEWFFMCIMRHGILLAIESDVVGLGVYGIFIIILGLHSWSFWRGGTCVGTGGVEECWS
jgi:hypothetical protein